MIELKISRYQKEIYQNTEVKTKMSHIKLIIHIDINDLVSKTVCIRSSINQNTLEALGDELTFSTLDNLGESSKQNEKCQAAAVIANTLEHLQKYAANILEVNNTLSLFKNNENEEFGKEHVLQRAEKVKSNEEKSTPLKDKEINKPTTPKTYQEIPFKVTKTPIYKNSYRSINKIMDAANYLFEEDLTEDNFENKPQDQVTATDNQQFENISEEPKGVFGAGSNSGDIRTEETHATNNGDMRSQAI